MGLEGKKHDFNSCPFDSERQGTASRPETEKSKHYEACERRPIEPDTERIEELSDAILCAMESGEDVSLNWVDEIRDICILYNRYANPPKPVDWC